MQQFLIQKQNKMELPQGQKQKANLKHRNRKFIPIW